MKSSAEDRPDVRVQFVRKGQVATFEVRGGFARKPAPSDGVLVESTTTTLFVTVEDLRRSGLEIVGRIPDRSTADTVRVRDDATSRTGIHWASRSRLEQ
jgi:hypothetical protein